MAESLKRRFADMLTQTTLLISTTLMPAYKLYCFETRETKDLAKYYVIQEALLLHEASLAQLQQQFQGQSMSSSQANPVGSSPTPGTSSTQPDQDEPEPVPSSTSTATRPSTGKYF